MSCQTFGGRSGTKGLYTDNLLDKTHEGQPSTTSVPQEDFSGETRTIGWTRTLSRLKRRN